MDLEVKDIFGLMNLCFKYMPSHIEVIEPISMDLSNLDFATLMNEILVKLHNYDAITKSAVMQNQMLVNKIQEIMNKQKNSSEDIEEEK